MASSSGGGSRVAWPVVPHFFNPPCVSRLSLIGLIECSLVRQQEKTTMRISSQMRWLLKASLLFLGGMVLFAASASGAGPLEDFTGYTRVGYPPAENKTDIKAA